MRRLIATSSSALASAIILLSVSPGTAQLIGDPPKQIPRDDLLTEQQDDHVEAVALYTHGRVLRQRALQLKGAQLEANLGDALRRFQRAWWFDHDLVAIMDEIVPIAYRLNRPAEATRYAILAVEQQEVPPDLVERVAAILAEQEKFARALALYQKVVATRQKPPSLVTQFEIGRLALLVGRFEESADAFARVRDALDGKGDGPITEDERRQVLRKPELTYALFGESFVRAKRLEDAETCFRAAHEAKPNRAMLGLRLALIEKERGNQEKARTELDEYLSSKSTSGGMLPYQLLVELIDGTLDKEAANDDPRKTRVPSSEALGRLGQLADSDPNNAMLGYFLADQLQRAKKLDQAEAKYKWLLEQKPAIDGHQGLLEIYLRQKRLDSALEQIGEVVHQTGSLEAFQSSLDPLVEDPKLLRQMADTIKKQTAVAEEEPPRGALTAIALLAAKAKQMELAKEYLDQALRPPGPAAGQSAVNFAFQMFQNNEAEEAAKVFQRILDEKLLPERTAEVHFYLSGAWTLAKDTTKALEAARQAARLEPDSSRMMAREPWVLYQAKRLDEAEQGYLKLLDRFDANHESDENREVMRDVRIILSTISVERDQIEAAEEWLQQVLDEFPDDIGAFNDLGYLWCDQGKHLNRSLTMIRKAVAAEPENIAYRDSLGWALYRLGKFAEAVKELKKAVDGDAVDGVILDHLGDAHTKLGQQEEALEAWRKAESKFTEQNDSKRLEKIQQKIKQHSRR